MKYIFSVPDMTCDHCKMRVTKALTELAGVGDVFIDLEEKRVEVQSSVSPESLLSAIDEAGYDAFLNESL